jgi:hypothetical protein
VRDRFARRYCRETIRTALRRLDLSWKKAKKLLGRAQPERRKSFVGQIGALLDGARDQQHTLVYLDEAHIHQDVDLGCAGRRIRHLRPVQFATRGRSKPPPLVAGTEPLGEAELPLTNNFIWQEENSSIRISLL